MATPSLSKSVFPHASNGNPGELELDPIETLGGDVE